MDITLVLNNRDFSSRVTKYSVTKELIAQKVVTTLDYVEHVPIKRFRNVIRFTLMPMSDETVADDYTALSAGTFTALYSDPHSDSLRTQTVHLVTDLDAVFGIKSVDGNRYYKGQEIVLRATQPGLGEEPQQND